MKHKRYIGDGVYVAFDGFAIWLTTENGIAETNKICLEPEVLENFERWLMDLKRRAEEGQK